MSYTNFDDGHISSPFGYRATGVSCGLKESTRSRDLGLIYSEQPCKAAAMFTTSTTKAAPVFFDQAILARNREGIRAVLINAGQANAGTGQPGMKDAVESAKLAADELEVPRDSVLLMSSGIIGVPIPMDKMREGIIRAVSELDSGAGRRAALAMLTTDTRPKERVYKVHLREGRTITLAGMAKGTRMVHPQLATLLAVVTTDLPIDVRLLQRSLQQSVSNSFNRLTIDGDTSPNDTVLILANGAENGPPIVEASAWEYSAWQEALDALLADLSQQIVRDAAGSGKIIQVTVRGAQNELIARQVALAVARSTAVRRACNAGQPDWGTLLAAVGASGVDLHPELLDLYVGDLLLMLEGVPVSFDRNLIVQLFSSPEIDFTIDLHLGPGSATMWTCTWHGEFG
ncbi:MAG: bifunctional glutamate N-acetyltransferase/amino-acid acetyltransferase ArgJ [Chloroflexaceae bacterium]|nr:bifunctional glutamate N-acetyltransferase/amino-acid acetyltransferase ArgJ [Chloroflexaceae bacterium]NJO06546.1 bifunctional glutamate N-acetyltransferase/amino-acid acetyltransferase ArgJ [Chloroflexaceae bacterium]